ncbi:MAG: hypothetical protein ABIK07_19915, partial [Planctomycetota bacterium]
MVNDKKATKALDQCSIRHRLTGNSCEVRQRRSSYADCIRNNLHVESLLILVVLVALSNQLVDPKSNHKWSPAPILKYFKKLQCFT